MRGSLVVALTLTLWSCAPGHGAKYLVEIYNWERKIYGQGKNNPPLQKGTDAGYRARTQHVPSNPYQPYVPPRPGPLTNFKEVEMDIKNLLTSKQQETFWPADYGNYGPLIIRLAWHASGSYRTFDGRGGADGGRQFFEPERSWEDNTNLDKARTLLKHIKDKHNGLSWADLIVLAGNVAIKEMGAPILGFCGGRTDDTNGDASLLLGPSKEQELLFPCPNKTLCKEPLGSSVIELIYVNPVGPLGDPNPIESAKDIRDVFGRMDMDDTETVALIAGGHEFGKTHGACSKKHAQGEPPKKNPNNPKKWWVGKCGSGGMKGKGVNTFTSGLEFPWTSNPISWDYEYASNLFKYKDSWKKEESPGGPSRYQWSCPNCRHAPRAIGNGTQKIGMLTTDIALLLDPKYRKILKNFHDCPSCLDEAFKNAWYKLTTRDMGPQSRCINKDAPPPQPWQHPLPKPCKLDNYAMVKKEIEEMIQSDSKMSGRFARLSFQCSSTFRSTDYLGGCNGARIRLEPQKDWPVNENLEMTLEKLQPIKITFGEDLSWADLIILAGNVAVEQHFGVKFAEEEFCPGRSDAMEGEGGPDYIKPKIGNAYDETNALLLNDVITTSGLTKREFTALYGGGYVIGEAEDCNGLFCLRRSFVKDKVLVPKNKPISGAYRQAKIAQNTFFKLLSTEKNWVEMETQSIYDIRGITIYKAKGKEEYMLPQDFVFRDDLELKKFSKEFENNDVFIKAFKKAWVKLANIDRFDGPTGNACLSKQSEGLK